MLVNDDRKQNLEAGEYHSNLQCESHPAVHVTQPSCGCCCLVLSAELQPTWLQITYQAPSEATHGHPKDVAHCHDAGTSSFGMSGVNAHLLVSAPDVPAQTASASPLPLTKARYWAGAFQHVLIHPSRQQQPGQYRWAVAWYQRNIMHCSPHAQVWSYRLGPKKICSHFHDSMTQLACRVEARSRLIS